MSAGFAQQQCAAGNKINSPRKDLIARVYIDDVHAAGANLQLAEEGEHPRRVFHSSHFEALCDTAQFEGAVLRHRRSKHVMTLHCM